MNILHHASPVWIKTVINAVLFQICWVACVIGGNHWALITLLLMVACQLLWITEREQLYPEMVSVLPLISAGIMFDTLLQHVGLLSFPDHQSVVIPFWLMALWMAFALTLHHSLATIIRRPVMAALLGGLGAPWSYFLGTELGSVEVSKQGLMAIGVFWAVLLFTFSSAQQWTTDDG